LFATFLSVTPVGRDALRAAPRTWSTTGANEQISVADCTDCGDDIGILMQCRGPGQPAVVTVHWAAVENGQEGAVLPIQFVIDDQVLSYEATARYYGQIGYTPEFKLAAGDPLIEALSAGKTALVKYASSDIEISLRGSRRSLQTFASHCGWTKAGVSHQ
jgi:hypothetical protein